MLHNCDVNVTLKAEIGVDLNMSGGAVVASPGPGGYMNIIDWTLAVVASVLGLALCTAVFGSALIMAGVI